MTGDDKTPVDQALDLFLYLPVGFLYELPRAIPRFIERGRRELHADGAAAARLDPARSLARIPEQARGTLRALGVSAAEPVAKRSARATTTTIPDPSRTTGFDADADDDLVDVGTDDGIVDLVLATTSDVASELAAAAAASDAELEVEAEDAVEVEGLAVPGYDSLAASQVVPRLDSLTADELEQVRRYEQANRGRKTILNKIAQLQAG